MLQIAFAEYQRLGDFPSVGYSSCCVLVIFLALLEINDIALTPDV